jgi:CO/xanthine dehydrogenase Mo-binding subunit
MGMTEEMLYDEKGRMRNPTFLDYQLLTSLDVPQIESILVEVPSPEGPYGARIVGEPPIIAASTALANAITDATGVRLHEAPMKPERVWKAIEAGARELVTAR